MSHAEQHPVPNDTDGSSQVLNGGAENVGKIRDILFGTQMRDYESHFSRLDETLLKETLDIRETNQRLSQLESYIRREFETVQSRFKSERDERLEVARQHSHELKELGDRLCRRIGALDDRNSAGEEELRRQSMEQARENTSEMRASHDELVGLIEQRVHELRDSKIDRAALSTLFTEVALRLSDHAPEKDE